MATTFTKIASVEVGAGGQASIDFTSIPATYTDLCILASVRATNNQQSAIVAINGSSTGSHRFVYGDGSTAASSNSGSLLWTYGNSSTQTASTFGNLSMYIPNYALTTQYKSISTDAVNENNATAVTTAMDAALVSSNAAITSISIQGNGGNLAQYSTAILYGIKNS